MNSLGKKLAAEFLGTFWLTFGGCGSAVLAAAFPNLGIGFSGVALAFGLTVLTGAYAFGPISGGHFNPAVSAGLATAGRFSWGEFVPYVVAQVLGAVAAAGLLYVTASGKSGFSLAGGFASNGFADHSPGGYSLASALLIEVVLTAVFLLVILGSTEARAAAGFALQLPRSFCFSRARCGIAPRASPNHPPSWCCPSWTCPRRSPSNPSATA